MTMVEIIELKKNNHVLTKEQIHFGHGERKNKRNFGRNRNTCMSFRDI